MTHVHNGGYRGGYIISSVLFGGIYRAKKLPECFLSADDVAKGRKPPLSSATMGELVQLRVPSIRLKARLAPGTKITPESFTSCTNKFP